MLTEWVSLASFTVLVRKGITDFFRDPMTTQTAIKGLTGLKQVDLKQKELENLKK